MLERLKIRVPDISDVLANELIRTAQDRIMLRVGLKSVETFPSALESICVEVVTAMYNKSQMQHEGVASESMDAFSMSFINDVLKEYDGELQHYKASLDDDEGVQRGKVRFL